MKPIGWRNESHRHYLASRGIKTNRQYAAYKRGLILAEFKGTGDDGKLAMVAQGDDEFLFKTLAGARTRAQMDPTHFKILRDEEKDVPDALKGPDGAEHDLIIFDEPDDADLKKYFAFKVEADRAREIEQKKEKYYKKLSELRIETNTARELLEKAKQEGYPEYLVREYEGVLAKAEQKQKEFEQRDWRTYMAKKDDEKKIVVWTEPYISQEPEGVAEVDFNERHEVVRNAQEARIVKKFIEDTDYKDANLSGESPRIVSFDEGERLRKLREDKKIKEFVHDKEFWKSFIDKEEDFHRGESSDSQYSPRHLLQFARDHDWGKNAKLSSDGKRIEGLTEQGTINGKPYFEKGKSVPAKMSELKRYGGY